MSYPRPDEFKDWRAWANKLLSALENPANSVPAPVVLQHVPDSATPKALRDGVILYDPALNSAIISVGGVWKKVDMT